MEKFKVAHNENTRVQLPNTVSYLSIVVEET